MRYVIALILLGLSSAAFAQDGSFTLATRNNGDGTLTPILTWDTNADSCEASGDADWEGAKPASGTEELPARATTQPRSFALVCSSAEDTTAFLAWVPPITNTDGSPLTNLAGFRVHYGLDSDELSETREVADPQATSAAISGLLPGRTYFFGVRAYNEQGAESALSNIVSKTTRAGVEFSAQTAIKVPAAPVASVQSE